jgi:serine/threonine-protein kinase
VKQSDHRGEDTFTRALDQPVERLDAGLPIGSRIGNYKIIDSIAAGGFGAVYRAEDVKSGRPAAVKILHADRVDSEVVERFHREVHVMEMLRHPNVVQFYELGVHEDGRPFFAMELLVGASLKQHLAEIGRFSPSDAFAVAESICDVLELAHQNDVIHRDIKASNVFLAKHADGARRVVLLDFGIAKMMSQDVVALTTSRHVIGTPTAMAPEQVKRSAVDARTDIYALGNLCFLMLTGRLPFAEASPLLCQHLHLHARPPRPGEFAPLPRALDELILKALQKNPRDRQQTVVEFRESFRAAIAGDSAPLRDQHDPIESAASPALAVYVEVFASEQDADEPDDQLLDDIEGILNLSRDQLSAASYLKILETGNSLLMVRGLNAGVAANELAKTVWPLAEALEQRQRRDARVHFNLCLHWSEHGLAGGLITDPEISSVASWAPAEPTDCLVCTARALSTTGARGILLDDANKLYRLTR